MGHKIHETLPDGFSYADLLQIDSFMATGSVDGAAKVCLVAGAVELPRLAVRLRPPPGWRQSWRDDYKSGWEDGLDEIDLHDDLDSSWWYYVAGYRDAAAGRMKWHLAYCADHDACGR